MMKLHEKQRRAAELLQTHISAIWSTTDQMFGLLVLAEYFGAIVWAICRGAQTWSGASSSIHPHIYIAVGIGGLVAIPTAYLCLFRSGQTTTRWIVSATQILMAALLIHISGGRIETHFLIFSSLAFIAFYRDWRLLIVATTVTLFDHILRGIYAPESVYGVESGAQWRFVEHALWVVLEDIVLGAACIRGMNELRLISDRQAEVEAAKEEAEFANRAKSQFLASMTHELRTPMNAVIGFAELIRNPSFGELSSRQAEFVEHITSSGKHLLGLINDILDLAKIESGTVDLQRENLSVAEIMQGAADAILPIAQDKQIAMVVAASDSVRNVRADAARTRQILVNLLNNAIKFSNANSTVALSAHERGDGFIELHVTDAGVGIKAEDCQRVFERFEQVDGSYARTQKGTGLGLAVCKSLVEAHGGAIWVESEGEGMGCTFKFSLPAVGSAGTAAEDELEIAA
jgi:signal transduction histidine kinase